MKVFVTGANGYIGKFLSANVPENWDFTKISSKVGTGIYLNLTEAHNFDYEMLSKDSTIIFMASISSPEICKNNYDLAYKVNVDGTRYFIERAIRKGSRVLFFSSDTVYGNDEQKYNEHSLCNPQGEYGKMKREIEKFFLGETSFKVFRLSYVLSQNDKFTKYLIDCGKKRHVAEVYHPFLRNVVYINDLYNGILSIVQTWEKWDDQIFNICGKKLLSRVDLANIFKSIVDEKLEYKVVTPGGSFYEARPPKIETDSSLFEKLLSEETTDISNAYRFEFNDKSNGGNYYE